MEQQKHVSAAFVLTLCLIGCGIIAIGALSTQITTRTHTEALTLRIDELTEQRVKLEAELEALKAAPPRVEEKIIEKIVKVQEPCRVTPIFPDSSRTRASAGKL